MKKAFLIVLMLMSIVSQSYSQQCSTCDTTRTMSTDPRLLQSNPDACISGNRANTFDWFGAQPGGAQSFYINKYGYNLGSTIPSPFHPANPYDPLFFNHLYNNAGPNNTINLFCHPEDGWELVKRDLGYYWDANGNTNVSTLVPISVSNTQVSYIMLYNKYTSVLRVLGTIIGTSNVASIEVDIQVKLAFMSPDPPSNPNGIHWSPSALFSHYSQDSYGKTVSQSIDKATTANQVMAMAHWEGNGNWFYADFMMSYDPCTCNNPSALSVNFVGISQATAKLQGRFYGVSQPITSTDPSNDATSWLSSVAVSTDPNNSSLVTPTAGMQTYALANQLTAEYTAALADFEDATAYKERNKTITDCISAMFSIFSAGGFSGGEAAAAEGGAEGGGGLGGLTSILKDGVSFFSGPTETATEPTIPWVVQGEQSLTGTITFSNTLGQAGFQILNPGSQNSNSNTFPEYTAACSGPSCVQAPLLPGYTYYNLPLGNFGVLTQPVVRHQNLNTVLNYSGIGNFNTVEDIYQFEPNSLKYVFNPAVPVDVEKSSVFASLAIDVAFQQQTYQYLTHENLDHDKSAFYYYNFWDEDAGSVYYLKMPISGFNDTMIALQPAPGDRFQLSTAMVPLEDLNSIIPTFARPWQKTISGNSDPYMRKIDAGVIQGVYLKLAVNIVFKPDPRYPNVTPKSRLMIATYPVTQFIDDQTLSSKVPAINTSNNPPACSLVTIGTTTYTQDTYKYNQIRINGNQTVNAGAKAYFYSCSDIYVQQESVLQGEFVLIPSYNPDLGMYTGGNSNNRPRAYSSINCSNTNTYKANISASRTENITIEAIDNNFNPTVDSEYLTVSPNPANSIVKLTCNITKQAEAKLYITDIIGNVVQNVFDILPQESSIKEEFIDVSGLTAGIYFCILDIEGHKEIKKLVVAK